MRAVDILAERLPGVPPKAGKRRDKTARARARRRLPRHRGLLQSQPKASAPDAKPKVPPAQAVCQRNGHAPTKPAKAAVCYRQTAAGSRTGNFCRNPALKASLKPVKPATNPNRNLRSRIAPH